jgi:hypothetical protein
MLCNSKYTINFVSFHFGQIIGFTLSCVQVWQNLLVYVPCSYSTIILLRRREAGPATYPCRDDDERFSSEKKMMSGSGSMAGPWRQVQGPGRPSLMDKDNQMRCCFRATNQLAEQTATIMVVVVIVVLRLIVEPIGRRCHRSVETNSRAYRLSNMKVWVSSWTERRETETVTIIISKCFINEHLKVYL